MCDDCKNNSDSGSSFIFGIFIGAVVAIYIYKNNKSDIFEKLKKTLESYFNKIISTKDRSTSGGKKITVTIPKKVESVDLTLPRPKKPAKMFKK